MLTKSLACTRNMAAGENSRVTNTLVGVMSRRGPFPCNGKREYGLVPIATGDVRLFGATGRTRNDLDGFQAAQRLAVLTPLVKPTDHRCYIGMLAASSTHTCRLIDVQCLHSSRYELICSPC